jgi:hypothetical protein
MSQRAVTRSQTSRNDAQDDSNDPFFEGGSSHVSPIGPHRLDANVTTKPEVEGSNDHIFSLSHQQYKDIVLNQANHAIWLSSVHISVVTMDILVNKILKRLDDLVSDIREITPLQATRRDSALTMADVFKDPSEYENNLSGDLKFSDSMSEKNPFPTFPSSSPRDDIMLTKDIDIQYLWEMIFFGLALVQMRAV